MRADYRRNEVENNVYEWLHSCPEPVDDVRSREKLMRQLKRLKSETNRIPAIHPGWHYDAGRFQVLDPPNIFMRLMIVRGRLF